MKTIICAVDFSPVSINAAHYAADLCMAVNAELLLVNVVQLPVTVSEVPITGYAFEEIVKDSETDLNKLKETLSLYVNNKINISVSTPVGSVTYVLRQEAERTAAVAIVMGADNTKGMEHLFKVNYAVAAIHEIYTPVLIVPGQAQFRAIKKIVLAADLRGSKKISTLRLLKEWIRIFQAQLDIVCVIKKSQPKPEDIAGSISLENELEQFDPKLHFIYEENVKEGIGDYIEQNHPDMLVILPGDYGFFTRPFHDSKSKQLVSHPEIPVLSILD